MPDELPEGILATAQLLEEGEKQVRIILAVPLRDSVKVLLNVIAFVKSRHYITQYINAVIGISRQNLSPRAP